MELSGPEAWANALQYDESHWNRGVERFTKDIISLKHRTKFQLSSANRYFCIGSCFARGIEEHLLYRSIDVTSKPIICPVEEWSSRPNGIVNKFTTHSILNEVRWALQSEDGLDQSFVQNSDGWIDLQLTPGAPSVSQQRAIERRHYLSRDYFARMRDSDVIIITLGLVEAWKDKQANLFLNRPPSFWQVKREPERFSVQSLSVDENLAALEETRAIIKATNPAARFIVTVSPVPMTTTFLGEDVLVANTLSKSTLRSVAGFFCDRHADADYFPSYEFIAQSPRASVFRDWIHVADSAVGTVVSEFCNLYLPDCLPAVEGFVEGSYLRANPDVEKAVREGQLNSGFEHWIKFGRAEGRALGLDPLPSAGKDATQQT
jgi:hypothetical protein